MRSVRDSCDHGLVTAQHPGDLKNPVLSVQIRHANPGHGSVGMFFDQNMVVPANGNLRQMSYT